MTRKNSQSQLTNQSQLKVILPAALTACIGLASAVSADPLPGEQLKFFQSPLNGGPPGVYPIGATPLPTDTPAPFLGHDEFSTAVATLNSIGVLGYTGSMMADDFLDLNPSPIGHVTFWGSYMNGTDPGPTGVDVTQFQISLYTDVPAIGVGTPNFVPSHPGQLLATQVVNKGRLAPSSGTFTVKAVPPNGPGATQPGDGPLYQYNAELDWRRTTFPDAYALNTANPDPVEWLSIVALVPTPNAANPPLDWGWHDRDYGIADPFAPAGSETAFPHHLLDDAVQGSFSLNGGPPVTGGYLAQNYISAYDGIGTSKDLAFALYTPAVPEPATISLIALATPALLVRRRRQA